MRRRLSAPMLLRGKMTAELVSDDGDDQATSEGGEGGQGEAGRASKPPFPPGVTAGDLHKLLLKLSKDDTDSRAAKVAEAKQKAAVEMGQMEEQEGARAVL